VLGHHVHYRDGVPLTEASPEAARDMSGRPAARAPGRAAARRLR